MDQLFEFSAAGNADLPMSRSPESHLIGFGRPLSRDGLVKCMTRPLIWGTRTVRRVARSSLSDEVVSMCTTIEMSYRLHAVLHGLVVGGFLTTRFQSISSSAFLTPPP